MPGDKRHADEHEAREQQRHVQDVAAHESREEGGDAPAAGSVAEREALAVDDDAFDEDDPFARGGRDD